MDETSFFVVNEGVMSVGYVQSSNTNKEILSWMKKVCTTVQFLNG